MPRGGRRPGAGKPKGYKHKQTLEKAAARDLVRQRIAAEIEPITDALINAAKGTPVLLARGLDQKWHRLTDPALIEKAYNAKAEGDDTLVRIYAQDPDVKALQQALDRVLGPVTQQIEHTGANGGPLIVSFGGRYRPAGGGSA